VRSRALTYNFLSLGLAVREVSDTGQSVVITQNGTARVVLMDIRSIGSRGAAYLAFSGFQTSTLNWQTFSQVAFAFKVTAGLLIRGLAWALMMGFVGALLPAIRAARLPISVALREL
jgi:putative ABC transport system permease protein